MKVTKFLLFPEGKVRTLSALITRMKNKIFSCVWIMDFMVVGWGRHLSELGYLSVKRR